MGVIAFIKTKGGVVQSFGLLFQRADALRIITVILIIITASFLALANKIEANGITAILSGISGFVLGSLGKESQKDDKDDKENDDSNSKKKKTFLLKTKAFQREAKINDIVQII